MLTETCPLELPGQSMDDPCRRRMLERLLANAAVSPADMAHLVASTDDYTGAQIEELGNTLYMLAVAPDNCMIKDAGAGMDSIPLARSLIDEALEDVKVERKARLGFHAA